MYLVFAIVLCLTAVSTTPIDHDNIHSLMTASEVQQTFGTNHDNVPKYNVVDINISHTYKRDTSSQKVLSVNTTAGSIILILIPADGFLASSSTPVTFVTQTPNGIEFKENPHVMEDIGELLEDPATCSLFVVSHGRDRRHVVNGRIGSRNLEIRSLPDRFGDLLSENGENLHVAYESEAPPPHLLDRRVRMTNPDDIDESSEEGSSGIPKMIFPQILVAIDATSYTLHHRNINNLVIHHLLLWHSVNVIYKGLDHPKVRINIARFVIARDAGGTPYIKDAEDSPGLINTALALSSAAIFWYDALSKIPNPAYDAVMIFTSNALIAKSRNLSSPLTYHTTRGFARAGQICNVDRLFKKYNAVAILQDDGNRAANLVAHELGRLFGLPKESEGDAPPCSEDDGYIMAATLPIPKSDAVRSHFWEFSPCSVRTLRQSLQLVDRSCLYNKPQSAGEIFEEILSYDYQRTVNQCTQSHGASAVLCKPSRLTGDEFCKTLYCQWNGSHHCRKTNQIPFDGTPCDNGGMYCEKGVCIED